MKVYKNNIVKIALKEKNLPAIDEILEGTCAYIFFENDSVDAAKVIKEAAQKLKKIEVLGGIADGKALNAEEAKAYADLPNRSQLLAMIAGAISGVARGLAVSINEIPAGLARYPRAAGRCVMDHAAPCRAPWGAPASRRRTRIHARTAWERKEQNNG